MFRKRARRAGTGLVETGQESAEGPEEKSSYVEREKPAERMRPEDMTCANCRTRACERWRWNR